MNSSKKIRVLIVDDSILMQRITATGLAADPSIEVVGTAGDPFDARDKILALEPDVMVLDINMPKMNGIEFLKKLIPQYPVPVVVVSSQTSSRQDALNAGAVDFIAKVGAAGLDDINLFIHMLILKIKSASLLNNRNRNCGTCKTKNKIIAIGASTGGTVATASILKQLKNDLPGILVVQHMPPGFTKMYAEGLNAHSEMDIKEAEDGDPVLPGHILVAAGEHHMKLISEKGVYKVRIFKGEKVNLHCPSIDILFHSVAEICKKNALGIILTGMGDDGARGLLHMKENGAFTIGQDEATSVVYGMPMVADKLGAVCEQHALDLIPKNIYKWFNKI